MATTEKTKNASADKPASKEKKSALDAMLDQYESNKSSDSDFDKVDLTKYFTDKLQQGQKNDERTIRILPSKDGGSPFQVAWWHSLQVDGKWVKIYCNEQNDETRCPLCEVEDALKATGDEGDKKLAKTYKPSKFYIAKVIDRSKEEEGVKFYRFKHNWSNDGVFDKLAPILRKRGDITDPRNGRDVTLSLGRDQNNFTKIVSIQAEDPSMLTEDPDQANLWYNDESTWRDVYKPKDMKYMEIIANQQKPVWDKANKCYVAEEEYATRESVTLDDEIKISKSELGKKSEANSPSVVKGKKFELKVYDKSEETNETEDTTEEVEQETAKPKTTGKKSMPF